MKTIAFVGISGVGKSTFLNNVSDRSAFVHLEASKLIKEEMALTQQTSQSSEELRTGAVLDNQELLARAFRRNIAETNMPIILDGHTIVDTGSGLLKIPASVFAEMNLNSIVFLQDHAQAIWARRNADHSRTRPRRTIEELADHQRQALLAASDIALELGVPLHVVTHTVGSVFCRIFEK